MPSRTDPGSQPLGLLVAAIERGSALAELGLTAGDRLVGIDGLAPRDLIDLQLELPVARRIVIEAPDGTRREIGLTETLVDPSVLSLEEAVPGGIRECNNHCEFCFIRGLPSGLRQTLYVFDDDYRYSFLWGNFLTLTNLDETDWERIAYQHLSPLNVSVHATDPAVRARMLNNRHAPPIVQQIERLGRAGIQINAQVVLSADMNDGEILDRTIDDLSDLYPTVQSLSVVPVGLTRFSRVKNIRRPTPDEARVAVRQCETWQAKLRPRLGIGFIYPSDELYLLSGRTELPSLDAYDGAPVLSNGVGLMRQMLDEWERLLSRTRARPPEPREIVWVTGTLAAPALEAMAGRWYDYAGFRPHVARAVNTFFGAEVTVSGLLTGADMIATLRSLPLEVQDIVLPRGAFGFDGRTTLDGVSAEEIGNAHPARVHLASTPRELLTILRSRPQQPRPAPVPEAHAPAESRGSRTARRVHPPLVR
ncbi:MAG: DUF512 domain-containing protein [Chloroflexota bacterium]